MLSTDSVHSWPCCFGVCGEAESWYVMGKKERREDRVKRGTEEERCEERGKRKGEREEKGDGAEMRTQD